MKLFTRKLLAPACAVWLAGCATIAPPQPPSLELPKPAADLRAVRKGDKVTLIWTVPLFTTDRQRLHSIGATLICRSLDPAPTQCGMPVGEAAPLPGAGVAAKAPGHKAVGTYADTLPAQMERENPLGFVHYAVEVLNASGRGAGLSNVASAPLVETLPSPRDFSARVSDQGVVLGWTGQLLSLTYPQKVRYVYRVYRREEGSKQSVLVGHVAVGGDAHPSLTDQSFEWQRTYYYHADTLTIVEQPGKPEIQVEGDDSPEIRVFADDVFPPGVPTGLEAAFSGPGQEPFIDLIWAPAADMDLAGYNVYRHEEGTAPVKVNAEVVKAPAYRDADVVAGKKYFYSVSAVDVRGNESGRSEEAVERVP